MLAETKSENKAASQTYNALVTAATRRRGVPHTRGRDLAPEAVDAGALVAREGGIVRRGAVAGGER